MDDFLSAEGLITDRLKAAAPQLESVYTAQDLASAGEGAQRTPAAHVMLDGLAPGEVRADGINARWTQTWGIVVAVRNANPRNPSGAHNAAGPVLTEVLTALQGWRPSEDHSPLEPTSSSYRPTYRAGFAYMPLAFETRLIIKGD